MARVACGHIFEHQEVSFILCSILLPLSPYSGDGISEKNISSLAWGSRHRILKARLVHWRFVPVCSLGIVLSTSVLGECRTHLCPSRTRSDTQSDKAMPVVGCSGAISDPAGKRRLILGAVKLVLFVSARRSCEPPPPVCS